MAQGTLVLTRSYIIVVNHSYIIKLSWCFWIRKDITDLNAESEPYIFDGFWATREKLEKVAISKELLVLSMKDASYDRNTLGRLGHIFEMLEDIKVFDPGLYFCIRSYIYVNTVLAFNRAWLIILCIWGTKFVLETECIVDLLMLWQV